MKFKMFVDDNGELKEVLDTGEFDALRALIAEEVAKCLKLSGGEMTGVIYGSGGVLRGKSSDDNIWVCGGDASSNSAYIQLNGGTYSSMPGGITFQPVRPSGRGKSLILDFDSLNYDGSAVLTSAGGEVSSLYNTSGVGMFRSVNNSSLAIRGGQSSEFPGGYVLLYGPNHPEYPGEARLAAKNSSTGVTHNLRVLTDGTATLATKQVLTLNSTATNSNGWYRKTSDGLIIQVINKPSNTATGTITVTLPTPMSNADYYVGVSFVGATGGDASTKEFGPLARTKNSFTYQHLYADRGTLSFIVIGY